MLLGFEEPELYQHPPQAQHIAAVLDELATGPKSNTQVIVSTHSPYFVTSKGFESVRVIRKHPVQSRSVVKSTTYAKVEVRLANSLGETPRLPTTLMAKVEQIMQPSQRELFFTPLVVLVEGIEDIASISTHLQLTGRWTRFRELGCHFVVAGGKSPMSRPLAISAELGIPSFVVFDSDANRTKSEERTKNAKDNSCILRLCGLTAFDRLPVDNLLGENVVMWKSNITNAIREEFADGTWDACEKEARDSTGFLDVGLKSTLLIAATLEVLYSRGHKSALLDRVAESLIAFAENVQR